MLNKMKNTIFCCGIILVMLGTNSALGGESLNKTLPVASPYAVLSKQVASINVNLADEPTLQKIKGMSKKKVQAIISYREKNGPFKSLEDLLKVNCRGIHKKWLENVSKFLTL